LIIKLEELKSQTIQNKEIKTITKPYFYLSKWTKKKDEKDDKLK